MEAVKAVLVHKGVDVVINYSRIIVEALRPVIHHKLRHKGFTGAGKAPFVAELGNKAGSVGVAVGGDGDGATLAAEVGIAALGGQGPTAGLGTRETKLPGVVAGVEHRCGDGRAAAMSKGGSGLQIIGVAAVAAVAQAPLQIVPP